MIGLLQLLLQTSIWLALRDVRPNPSPGLFQLQLVKKRTGPGLDLGSRSANQIEVCNITVGPGPASDPDPTPAPAPVVAVRNLKRAHRRQFNSTGTHAGESHA